MVPFKFTVSSEMLIHKLNVLTEFKLNFNKKYEALVYINHNLNDGPIHEKNIYL